MEYTCPNCKAVLEVSDTILKQKTPNVKCPKCGHVFNPIKETPFDGEKMAKLIRQLLNSDLH